MVTPGLVEGDLMRATINQPTNRPSKRAMLSKFRIPVHAHQCLLRHTRHLPILTHKEIHEILEEGEKHVAVDGLGQWTVSSPLAMYGPVQ